MYVFTEKEDNRITCISETLEYQSNGNPVVKNGAYAIGYPVNIYENVEVPEGVIENKYCYTPEQGFYKNPNWQAPPMSLEERVKNIELAMAEDYESKVNE